MKIKKILGWVFTIALVGFVGSRLLYPFALEQTSLFRKFPAPADPKQIVLECNYHGSKLTVAQTLYGSINNYYKTDPKKKAYYFRNDNKSFVYSHKDDDTIGNLADKIEAIGKSNNLNSDQTLDLAACFIQSIPYDSVKAKKILGPNFSTYPVNEVIPRYPYEALYDFTGICTDKSFLGAAVLSELGYKTALLSFSKEKHLSLGVGVPAGYGELGTDFGIMELTGKNFLVGDIPEISPDQGLAENTITSISSDFVPTEDKRLSNASKVENVSDGKSYMRIADRTKLRTDIDTMMTSIKREQTRVNQTKVNLDSEEARVRTAENNYKANPTNANYQSYLSVYSQYKRVYSETNSIVSSYNKLIDQYNALVKTYQNF